MIKQHHPSAVVLRCFINNNNDNSGGGDDDDDDDDKSVMLDDLDVPHLHDGYSSKGDTAKRCHIIEHKRANEVHHVTSTKQKWRVVDKHVVDVNDDDDGRSVMLEDLENYNLVGNNKRVLQGYTLARETLASQSSCTLITNQRCRYNIKENDDSFGDDDDDTDDDDDKSVMLEDLECHMSNYQNSIQSENSRGHDNEDPEDDDCSGSLVSGNTGEEGYTPHERHKEYRTLTLKQTPAKVPNTTLPTFVEYENANISTKAKGILKEFRGDDDDDDEESDDALFLPDEGDQLHDDEDYVPHDKHKRHVVRRVSRQKEPETPRKQPRRRTRRRTPQLWVFLLNSLCDPERNPSIIEWKDKEQGIFKLKNSKQIAQIWGERIEKVKKKPMDYEKFSRAIRYYYHKNVILSGPGRLTYQFGPKAKGWREKARAATL